MEKIKIHAIWYAGACEADHIVKVQYGTGQRISQITHGHNHIKTAAEVMGLTEETLRDIIRRNDHEVNVSEIYERRYIDLKK